AAHRPTRNARAYSTGRAPAPRPRRGLADGERARSTRGGAGLHPGTRVVSAGGRDTRAGPGPLWAVAVLRYTVTVPNGARVRGDAAAPGATCPRPRARGHRALYPRGYVVRPGRVAGFPPAPGRRHRPLHTRAAPGAGVPHGPRSGCGLPSLCRAHPLVTGVPGASPGSPPRGPGVGTRAVASLQSGVCAVFGGHCRAVAPGRVGRARAGAGHRRALDRAGLYTVGRYGNELARVGAG